MANMKGSKLRSFHIGILFWLMEKLVEREKKIQQPATHRSTFNGYFTTHQEKELIAQTLELEA